MRDEDKTKAQLIDEVADLRQRIAELEASAAERKRVEEALQESESRFRMTFQQAAIGMAQVDMEGHPVMSNPALQDMLGYSGEELRNMTFSDFTHPDDVSVDLNLFQEMLTGDRDHYQIVKRYIRKDGQLVWTRLTASLVRDTEGAPLYGIGMVQDITERKEAEETLQQRTAQLEALREIGLELTAQLDLDALLRSIALRAVELVEGTEGGLYLYRSDRNVLEWAVAGGPHQIAFGTVLQRGEGLAGKVWETGEPLIVDDYQHWEGQAAIYEGYPVTSTIGVPVHWGGLGTEEEFLGVLNINGSPTRTFSATDIELLSLFATQAAIAIRNARLYEQAQQEITERKRVEKILRRRAKELAALQATVLDITTLRDLPALLQIIVERAVRLLNAVGGGLYLCNPEQEEARCVVSYNTPRDYSGTVLKYGEGAAGAVAQTGEPLIIDDYRTWSRRATVYEEEQPFTAIVSAPMIWQSQVTGVIHVLDNVKNRCFTQGDLDLLILFANHAAIAVENTRLFEETQRQSKRLAKTLTSSELLHSDLGLAQVLEQITKGVVELGFQRAVLNVYQPEEKVMKVEAVSGLEGEDHEMLMGATYRWPDFQALMQERFQISRSYLIRHGDIDWRRDFQGTVAIPEREERGPAYWHPEDTLLIPLWGTKGESVGLISADEPVDAFLPDLNTIQTLEAFANQAAIAIENARLYEAAKELHKQTRRDAETKAMLLHEVNHRVKNNLAAIIGLLYIEKRHAQEEDLATHQTILTDMINRIQGLATVHNMLSDSEWSSLALSDLTIQVIHSALQLLPPYQEVSVVVPPAPVRVMPVQANSLALVINELATNTVKYALPAITQRHPIRITVHVGYEDDLVLLEFRDNGPGYPEEVLRLEQHNVGMYLIQNIVSEQLHGELSFYNDQGAVTTIRFKALEK